MRAVVKYARGPGNIELRTVPDPTPGPGEVVVAVRACGVDRGGDLYLWHATQGMPYEVPVVVGAENCGEVVGLGQGVDGWRVGDRVVCEVILGGCGRCRQCLSGRELHCAEKRDLGRRVDGAFADYFVAPAHRLHRIPDGVPWQAAVLTEMAAVAARTLLEAVVIRPGDHVAIVGPGPIGLIATQLAVASGAGRVLVIGRSCDETRLSFARRFGATDTVTIDDRAEGLAEAADVAVEGFEVVVEATGSPSGVGTAMQLCAPHATVAAIGTPVGASVSVPWAKVAMRDLTIRGTYAHRWETFERVLAMMARGQLHTAELYTRSWPLEDWETAFRAVETRTDLIKVGLCPAGPLEEESP